MWFVKYVTFLILLSNIGFILNFFFLKKTITWIKKYALDLAIATSLAATLGSLYLSEVVLLPPCQLCWYQRIFMYPLVFILITARVRKIKKIWEIVLPLALVGLGIAIYHYFLQLFPEFATTCGFSTPCTDTTIKEFGYITIPWMSITSFAYIIFLMYALKLKETGSGFNLKKVLGKFVR